MELQDNGSFVWQAPFHPDDPLPWLDAEHDVGPAVLQIYKMGPKAWKGQRSVVSQNYNMKSITDTPHSVILAFERLTPRQVCRLFSRGVGRPVSYRHGPIKIGVSTPSGYREHLTRLEETLGKKRAPYFGPAYEYPNEARSLWEGYRGIEEYAREVFATEEAQNGLTWMEDGSDDTAASTDAGDDDDMAEDVDARSTGTPIRLPLRFHPEAEEDSFFVGSC